jgi:hypothetical protein
VFADEVLSPLHQRFENQQSIEHTPGSHHA